MLASDVVGLRDVQSCFSSDRAGPWAVAAAPMISSALPHLSASTAVADDGFTDALMALCDVLDALDVADPEKLAFELCDRLTDVLELLPEI